MTNFEQHIGYRNPDPGRFAPFRALRETFPVLYDRLHLIQSHKCHGYGCSYWAYYNGTQTDGTGVVVGAAYSGARKTWPFRVVRGVLYFGGVRTDLRKWYCAHIYGKEHLRIEEK